jgi:hypothetical protein
MRGLEIKMKKPWLCCRHVAMRLENRKSLSDVI